jgi:hypothetical protein
MFPARLTQLSTFKYLRNCRYSVFSQVLLLIYQYPNNKKSHFTSIELTSYPIGSMYAIYGNIYHQYTPNVSIYTSTMDPMGIWHQHFVTSQHFWFPSRRRPGSKEHSLLGGAATATMTATTTTSPSAGAAATTVATAAKWGGPNIGGKWHVT